MAGILSNRPHSATDSNPFQPGRGKLPPYLAGREKEQALIREFLDVLTKRDSPASDIVLYGPRGNGKTVLLEWSQREATTLNLTVADLQGGDIGSEEDLADALSVNRRWLEPLRGFTLGPISIRLGTVHPGRVSSVLARSVRTGPFLILVDEAHMLGVGPGRSLLAAVQALQRKDLPILLILAGTPDLPRHLGRMEVSFWDRGEQLPIGRLDPGSAADAIRVPLEEHGRSIEDGALRQVVKDSHGYAFFLQVWGDLLWASCKDPSVAISVVDVDSVRPAVERKRHLYYARRYQELVRADLLPAAVGAAGAFSGSDRARPEQVYPAIQSALKEAGLASDYGAVIEATGHLHDLGYLWQAGAETGDYFEPGIPSLMGYVERRPDLGIRR